MENLMHQLQEYFYNQFPIIEQNNLIVIITALVIALLYVFFGYKLLRVYISLLGFLIGVALGIVICAVFDLSNTTAVIVIICVCAVALAALGFWLYKAGLFVMILLSLFPIILSIVSEFTTIQPVFMWIGSILFALVLAILAMFFVRPVVIIVTAVSGGLSIANLIINSLLPEIAQVNTVDGATIFMLIIGAVIAVLGIYFQFVTTKPAAKSTESNG
ncbi:MAG: DUF4203 domain-containing protein [Eubacteriales bacterium]